MITTLIARHDMAQLCYAYSSPGTINATFVALPRFEGATPVMFTPSTRVRIKQPERFGPYDPDHFHQWVLNFANNIQSGAQA